MLDLEATLAAIPADAHIYCGGPTAMIAAVRAGAQSAGIASPRVHFEYFSSEVENATEGGFTIVLHKSGDEIVVEPGQTILHALTQHGLNVDRKSTRLNSSH